MPLSDLSLSIAIPLPHLEKHLNKNWKKIEKESKPVPALVLSHLATENTGIK